MPLTKHFETRGGIREKKVPYGRKDIMKKIILIIIASIMFANIGFAEMKRIEEKSFNYLGYQLSTVCVDGFKFVVASSNRGNVSVVQFMRQNKPHGTAYPVKC